MPESFLKLMKTPQTLQLLKHPKSLALLCAIGLRANRTDDDCEFNGLGIGEAPIGDYENYGLTRSEYRAAIKRLANSHQIATKTTSKGTVAKLISKAIIDINESDNDQQTTTTVPKHDHKTATTKEEEIRNKNNITNVISGKPENSDEEGLKKNPSEKSSLSDRDNTPPVPGAPPYGRQDINKMLEALKLKIEIHAFVDSAIERNMARHCVGLMGKIGKDEFVRRLEALLADPFHSKNMNKIKYVYNNIKGFKEIIAKSPSIAFIS